MQSMHVFQNSMEKYVQILLLLLELLFFFCCWNVFAVHLIAWHSALRAYIRRLVVRYEKFSILLSKSIKNLNVAKMSLFHSLIIMICLFFVSLPFLHEPFVGGFKIEQSWAKKCNETGWKNNPSDTHIDTSVSCVTHIFDFVAIFIYLLVVVVAVWIQKVQIILSFVTR